MFFSVQSSSCFALILPSSLLFVVLFFGFRNCPYLLLIPQNALAFRPYPIRISRTRVSMISPRISVSTSLCDRSPRRSQPCPSISSSASSPSSSHDIILLHPARLLDLLSSNSSLSDIIGKLQAKLIVLVRPCLSGIEEEIGRNLSS